MLVPGHHVGIPKNIPTPFSFIGLAWFFLNFVFRKQETVYIEMLMTTMLNCWQWLRLSGLLKGTKFWRNPKSGVQRTEPSSLVHSFRKGVPNEKREWEEHPYPRWGPSSFYFLFCAHLTGDTICINHLLPNNNLLGMKMSHRPLLFLFTAGNHWKYFRRDCHCPPL